jgi:tetratricopeptide (TPR) repeat protein
VLSHHDIGAIQRTSGRAAASLASYERARAISEKLAQANPGATEFLSDLAQSYNDIGFLHQESGELKLALESLGRARAILQKLADANPAVTRFEGDLAQDLQVIGSILDQTGHPAEALQSFERARAILSRLAELYPTLTLFQNRLAMSHSYVGLVRRRSGKPAEAAAEFRRAVAIMEQLSARQPDGFNLYNLACFRALLSGTATEPGSGLTSQDVSTLGKQAVTALRQAVGAGFRNVGFMRRDTDLDAIRGRQDFQDLLLDVAFPAMPFASKD